MSDILNLTNKHWLVKSSKSSVGRDIELYCPKCKLVRRVKVTAAVNDNPTHIQCYHCQKESKVVAQPKAKATRPGATKPKANKRVPIMAQQQNTIDDLRNYEAMITKIVDMPVPYSVGMPMEVGAVINHSSFGIGFAIESGGPSKMVMLFRTGKKTLAVNR